jgi:hypothetical protein
MICERLRNCDPNNPQFSAGLTRCVPSIDRDGYPLMRLDADQARKMAVPCKFLGLSPFAVEMPASRSDGETYAEIG